MQKLPNWPAHTSLPAETRALLFDLDDTLYDRGATFYRWAGAFVQSHLPPSEHEAGCALLCQLDANGTAARVDLFQAFQRSYPGLYEVAAIIETYYQQFPAYMELGHMETLRAAIRHARMPIGIVTNGFVRQQQGKIAALGLDTLCSCIFISEQFGAAKPAAAIFLAAAASLQVPAEQILFIGDNPTTDICGAHQVGMRTLWIRHDTVWPADIPFCADMSIHSVEELPALIAPNRVVDRPWHMSHAGRADAHES